MYETTCNIFLATNKLTQYIEESSHSGYECGSENISCLKTGEKCSHMLNHIAEKHIIVLEEGGHESPSILGQQTSQNICKEKKICFYWRRWEILPKINTLINKLLAYNSHVTHAKKSGNTDLDDKWPPV